ncbi:MAG: hypothetical protein M3R17_20255 [Bacteroidota bacterium]|nr:hypothetical protein [Bacteroidota bacterium]
MFTKKPYFIFVLGLTGIALWWIGCPTFAKYSNKSELEYYGPLKFLIQSDKDNAWTKLLFIEQEYDSIRFDDFLSEALEPANMNQRSIIQVTRYIRVNNKREFLPHLKRKYCQFLKVPIDSCRLAIIKAVGESKKSNNELLVTYYLREAVAEFEH